MLQNNVTITFKSDVKLEAIEDDRFMVCCLEDRDACSQVTGMIERRTEYQKSVLRFPMDKDGWAWISQVSLIANLSALMSANHVNPCEYNTNHH